MKVQHAYNTNLTIEICKRHYDALPEGYPFVLGSVQDARRQSSHHSQCEVCASEPKFSAAAYNFETMTADEALAALADLDAQKWGESEREASRRLNAAKSRGLLINAIAHHSALDFGDALDAATRKAAKSQLTPADKAELRKGG